MATYIGLMRKVPASDYGVSFPDFPGCITAGRTLDEAHRFAEEALSLHIEAMHDHGYQIPDPSTLDQILANHENADAIPFLVKVDHAASRVIRLNISLDERLVNQIDRVAKEMGKTRSGFLADVARAALRRSG